MRTALLGTSTISTNEAKNNGVDRRWLVLVGLLMSVAIGWSSWSGSSPQPTLDGEAAADAVAVPTTPSTSAAAVPTPAQSAPSPTHAPTVWVVDETGPLLGESTGLQLILRGSRVGLAVLDLDAGVLIDGIGVQPLDPVAVGGDFLLARHYERLVSVPLATLAADPVGLIPGRRPSGNVAEPWGDGLVWIDHRQGIYRTYVLLDAATGVVIDEFDDHDGTSLGSRVFTPPGGREVVSAADGGIYERAGGRFDRVSDGMVLAADSTRVLVSICDPPSACRRSWLDRATWEPIELVSPAGRIDAVSLGEGADWLTIIDYDTFHAAVRLLHVVTGEQREAPMIVFDPFVDPAEAVSPDGRWMARVIGGDIEVVEVVSGDVFAIDLPEQMQGSVVFTAALAGYAEAIGSGG